METTVYDEVQALRDRLFNAKPNDRTDKDRAYAVLITKLEEAAALAAYHKI
jgi:hypothetical protein